MESQNTYSIQKKTENKGNANEEQMGQRENKHDDRPKPQHINHHIRCEWSHIETKVQTQF